MSDDEKEFSDPRAQMVKAAAPALGATVHEIYKDGLQPAVKQVGKSLEIIAKTINIVLTPFIGLVWGFEKIRDKFINEEVAEKLKDVPPENIQTPNPHVAGPLIEAVRFTGENDDLRDMFAQLLATAMNKDTADRAHPSFVEAIKQMTSDEAKILVHLRKVLDIPIIDVRGTRDNELNYTMIYRNFCDLPMVSEKHLSSYVDNLCRLRLLEIPYGAYRNAPGEYVKLFEKAQQSSAVSLAAIEAGGAFLFSRQEKILTLTAYGEHFCKACLPKLKRKARAKTKLRFS